MLNSQDNNSFEKNHVQPQRGKRIKKINRVQSKLIRDSFFRLRPLFLQDPVSHEPDPKFSREVIWFLYHPFRIEDYTHIFYFLSSMGFRLIREEKSYYHFRFLYPKKISVHVEVNKISEGFNVRAHLDIGIHKDITCNTLTSSILSELAYYLQQVDSHSQTITRTIEKSSGLDLQDNKELSTKIGAVPREAKTQFKPKVLSTNVERGINQQSKVAKKSKTQNKPIIIRNFRKNTIRNERKKELTLHAGKEIKRPQRIITHYKIRETIAASPKTELDHKEIYDLIEHGKKLEEEWINREIFPFITKFREVEFEKIYCNAKSNKDFIIERDDLKQRIRAIYERKIEGISSLYREFYIIKFEEYLSEEFENDFINLSRRLHFGSNKSKPRINRQLKEWIMDSRGDLIIFFMILGLVLTVYFILQWIISLPLLERFEFFNNNLWIVFLISFLIFIIVILVILVINSVRSYFHQSRIN